MVKHVSFTILLLALVSGQTVSYAQPIQSAAFDSACYQPMIGDHSQIDTIYGSKPYQELGNMMINLGPKPGGYGNMLIGGLSPSVALAQVTTGPSFNLHRMNATQKFASNFIGTNFRLGHFRDRSHLDIFDDYRWRIYWADDVGNYDSLRFTNLRPHIPPGDIKGNYGIAFGGDNDVIQPYIAHLINDTIDDIVTSCYSSYIDPTRDTAFLLLFPASSLMSSKDTIYEDTSLILYPMLSQGSEGYRGGTQADFRGGGRQDLILEDDSISGVPNSSGGNLWYYRNDVPFSLDKFAQAIRYDTLMVKWQNPHLLIPGPIFISSRFTMIALPRKSTDKSIDFMPVFKTDYDNDNRIFIFRGGPDFGSHRITLDSAAFVIRHPKNLDPGTFGYAYFWPAYLVDAGDMTGTGNRVLYVEADDGIDYGFDNFYVTGKALDEKIDIYNGNYAGRLGDTMTANADSLEDFMMGSPGFTSDYDLQNGGKLQAGTLWVYKGTKQIPVRLNPQWAAVVKSIPQENGAGFTLSPNPAQAWTVATIVWPDAEEARYTVRNLLGSAVQAGTIRMLGGAEEIRLNFPNLSSGVYELMIQGESHEAQARLVIVR